MLFEGFWVSELTSQNKWKRKGSKNQDSQWNTK